MQMALAGLRTRLPSDLNLKSPPFRGGEVSMRKGVLLSERAREKEGSKKVLEHRGRGSGILWLESLLLGHCSVDRRTFRARNLEFPYYLLK